MSDGPASGAKPGSLRPAPRTSFVVRYDLVPSSAAGQAGDLVARHGITLHELMARKASLEEAFMKLTRDPVPYRPHQEIPA